MPGTRVLRTVPGVFGDRPVFVDRARYFWNAPGIFGTRPELGLGLGARHHNFLFEKRMFYSLCVIF